MLCFVFFLRIRHPPRSPLTATLFPSTPLFRSMGMLVDHSQCGFGFRSRRYSLGVEDGVIEHLFLENRDIGDDPFEVSDAITMLDYLDGDRKSTRLNSSH